MSRRLFVFALLFLVPTMLSSQEWAEVSPEEAASHLLKKVEPAYTPFGKAAAIEGVVRIRVSITTIGRIGSVGIESGPPSLFQSAEDAILRYGYRPFEKDGRLVNVQTTVDVVFKLGEKKAPPPPPAPPISSTSFRFNWADNRRAAAQLSSELRKWIVADLEKQLDYLSCDDPEATSALNALKVPNADLPESMWVLEIPVKNADAHLYLVSERINCVCGATGNCPISLVQENSSGVRVAGQTIGWGFYAYPREGSAYPDVFIPSHMSATQINVVGYSNVAGEWGQLYCGEIDLDDKSERDNVEACH